MLFKIETEIDLDQYGATQVTIEIDNGNHHIALDLERRVILTHKELVAICALSNKALRCADELI